MELVELLKGMMRSEPSLRLDACQVYNHPVIARVRASMDAVRENLGSRFESSALASVSAGWLQEMLGRSPHWDGDEDDEAMDMSF